MPRRPTPSFPTVLAVWLCWALAAVGWLTGTTWGRLAACGLALVALGVAWGRWGEQ